MSAPLPEHPAEPLSEQPGDPLKIAIVRARYNPYGGAERFVQRALAALSTHPVAVSVIARRWPEQAAGESPVAMHFEKVDPFYLGSRWRDASFARAVTRLVASRHYDLVQSHERIPGLPVYRSGDGVHAEYLAQRARVLPAWRNGLIGLSPYHRYVLAAERAMFEHPALQAVICNSNMVREEIAARFAIDRSRLFLVRNGVDLQRFEPATPAKREQARARLRLDPAALVGAYVGSGFERKGLAMAISALAHANAPRTAVLLVAGADKHARRYRQHTQALGVAARVRFLGPVQDVRAVLDAADYFVLPTLYDPFPNAVLEAMACGLPVITSTKSGAAELLEPGRNGFVTDALDLGGIAAAIGQLADEGARRAMGMAARVTAEACSIERLGEELVRLYRGLLGRNLGGSTVESAPP